MALYYGFKIEQRQGELVLLGSPYPGHKGQEMEIGRTRGISSEVMKISLDPGWRFTKRAFSGQKLNHVYLAQEGEPLPIPTSTPTPPPPDNNQPIEDTQPSTDGGEPPDETQPTSPDRDESSGNDQPTSGSRKSSPSLVEKILGPVQRILPFLIPLL